ncbi:DUF1648 domain-containing protein [Streptomyces oceani]|uniref:DUF1648 domain-containing protein n=1 Tax=Streptomyces oceani TaxID=1075402 RepID=A0A1E7KJG4_9ACTN|nr:DUF1648 domain-containing protein [Streptomyces oceani]OEV03977.1 hypothetical protein AN216_09785 [Streptomyces oceani]
MPTEQRPPFPWLWLAPGLVLLFALLVWGVLVYPELPERVPQHFGPEGVDRYAAKSVGSVFVPVFVYAGVLAVMVGVAELARRIRPESELRPGEHTSPMINRPRTRADAVAITRATLFLGSCVGVTFAVSCTVMWRTDSATEPSGWLLAASLLPVAVGTVGLLVAALRGRKKRPIAPER